MMRILIIAWIGMFLPAGLAAQEKAIDIVRKADQLLRGNTQQGTYKMQVIRPDWQRSMRFRFWSKGTEKSFILILEPARDRGVTFLKLKSEMWNYVPRINRVIKIPPSMMLQSWMGSDFTNDDLVKESNVVTDYEHKLLGREKLNGDETYVIEMLPKAEAAVVWGRIVEWIRVGDYIPVKIEYYNERNERVRTLWLSDIKRMGGRTIPTRLELTPEKKPQNKTVLILEKVVFDRPVPDYIFTLQHLKKPKIR